MFYVVAKQYIYRKRCKKEHPVCFELSSEIYKYKDIEKYQAIKSGKYKKYCEKWGETIPEEHARGIENLSNEQVM